MDIFQKLIKWNDSVKKVGCRIKSSKRFGAQWWTFICI